jgi:hypothetical protein
VTKKTPATHSRDGITETVRAKREYYQVTDGEWIRVAKRGYKDQCCSCGLVHKLNFRIVDGEIEIQTFRDGKATGGARRRKELRAGKFDRKLE